MPETLDLSSYASYASGKRTFAEIRFNKSESGRTSYRLLVAAPGAPAVTAVCLGRASRLHYEVHCASFRHTSVTVETSG